MVDAPPPNTLAILSPEEIAEALTPRADACLRLAPGLEDDLDANDLTHILREVEMPLAVVLAAIESRGVAIDVQALRDLSRAMQDEIETLGAAIHADAGGPFNINSPKQLGKVLFETLGLPAGPQDQIGVFHGQRRARGAARGAPRGAAGAQLPRRHQAQVDLCRRARQPRRPGDGPSPHKV